MFASPAGFGVIPITFYFLTDKGNNNYFNISVMKSENLIQEKSYHFALRIIKLHKYLVGKGEYVLSRQILRSGTSIGANVEEAIGCHTSKDFLAKFSIVYKEARETHYWLRLLKDSESLSEKQASSPKKKRSSFRTTSFFSQRFTVSSLQTSYC